MACSDKTVTRQRLTIRQLRPDDIEELLQLTKAEKRQMGLRAEIETWRKFDAEAMFVAHFDDGKIIGSCSGMRLTEEKGYVGMFVVHPNHRGGGYGRMLWEEAYNRLEKRNRILSSVPNMFNYYRDRWGFTKVSDWTVDLWTCDKITPPPQELLSCSPGVRLASPSQVLDEVLDYDRKMHGYDRSVVLRSTFQEQGIVARVALNQQDDVVGFCCAKPGLQDNWLLAPLYADDHDVAALLASNIMSCLPQDDSRQGAAVKVPSANELSARLMHTLGFHRQDYRLRRCHTVSIVDIPVHRIFALQTSIFCSE